MTDEPKNDPRSRMRSLLGSANDAKVPERTSSPLTRLPRKAASVQPEETAATPIEKPAMQMKDPPQARQASVPVSPGPSAVVKQRRRYSFGPAFWTITGILSLIVNAILIAVLIGLVLNLPTLQVDNVANLPPALLGGLYTNFEKMDRAHIRTSVDVSTMIPVKFDLLLNQQTNVVLSQDVRIDNARVTVNTGGLNITNALTTIILPAGTNLPVFLSLTVPVDQQVPVTLNVPVDIPLRNTDLHEPFTGLQEVIRPLYCVVAPQSVNLDGQAICSPTQ